MATRDNSTNKKQNSIICFYTSIHVNIEDTAEIIQYNPEHIGTGFGMDKITFGRVGDDDGKFWAEIGEGLSVWDAVVFGVRAGPGNLDAAVSSDHPERPNFNPDFGKMNQEFQDNIRSRHLEQWD